MLLASVLASSVALADGFDYSVIGNGCVPTNTTIEQGLYENRGVGVGFKSGAVGTITLTCPLTLEQHDNRTWHEYTVFYRDTDGEQTGGYINISLRYADFGAPDIWKYWFNTTISMPSTTTSSVTADIPDVSPGAKTFWWFTVNITRRDPKIDVEFLGVELS